MPCQVMQGMRKQVATACIVISFPKFILQEGFRLFLSGAVSLTFLSKPFESFSIWGNTHMSVIPVFGVGTLDGFEGELKGMQLHFARGFSISGLGMIL